MAQESLYFENTLPESRGDDLQPWIRKVWGAAREALRLIESRLNPDDNGLKGGSVYVGLTGIALMYFHLAVQWDSGM